MLVLGIVLVNAAFSVVQPYNIEVRDVYPVYLRDGGAAESDPSLLEPAYAGYSFDATTTSGNTRILVGQPRQGRADSYSSAGSIYFCNVTFEKESSGAISSGIGDDVLGSAEGTMQSEYLIPECQNVSIFDPTIREQVGGFHKYDTDAMGLHLSRMNDSDNYAVCAQGRQRECTGLNKTISTPGACYYGSPVTDTWTFLKWNESKCFDSTIDIIFVVDGSMSIGKRNFDLVKEWLVDTIGYLLERYGDAISTEVLQYSNKDPGVKINESREFEIPYVLNDVLPIDEIENRIQNMRYLNGNTQTYFALRRVSEWEFLQSAQYAESKKVVVVLTDGAASDASNLPIWWEKYGATGLVTPFAIGVGDHAKFRGQLQIIANGGKTNDRVLTVDDFVGLQSVISRLIIDISTAVASEGQSANQISSDQRAANSTNNRQMGSSITALQDGTLHFGTVGMYMNSGAVMRFDSALDKAPDVPEYTSIARALPERTSDSYLGYTTVSGYFNGRSEGEFIAASAPRYKMKGAVVIYKPLKNSSYFVDSITILPPNDDRDQVATYFGGCLLSVDVSGDGFDDLFVASPLFVGENYDEGMVSVYIGSHGLSTTEWAKGDFVPQVLTGDKTVGSRFGSAMADAGDLNLDGFQDVIIGAPLADEGKGAVFVYHGKAGGITSLPSQKIFSSSISGPSLQYFGQSLQGDIDVDGNGYPDILVGAPKADSIVLLKTRPIVRISPMLRFLDSDIDLFWCINNGYEDCATLEVCFTANGTSVEDAIMLMYTLTLDPGITSENRVIFNASSSKTISRKLRMTTKSLHCFNYTLNLLKTATDFISSLKARVDYDLTPEHTMVPMSSVIDPLINKSDYTYIKWNKGCAASVCVPDLSVTGNIEIPEFYRNDAAGDHSGDSPPPALVISSLTAGEPVTITINFTNNGENAFNTKLKMTFPTNITLGSINIIGSSPASIACVEADGPPSPANRMMQQYFSHVDDANVMRPGSWCQFEVTAFTDTLRESATLEALEVTVSINSTLSSENATTIWDNHFEQAIQIQYESNFGVRSERGDTEVTFNNTADDVYNITSIPEIGKNTPDVTADIKVIATGYSNIPLSEITFTYPWLIDGNHPLLYLYELGCSASNVETKCTCDTSSLNRYNLSKDMFSPSANQTTTEYVEITPLTSVLSGEDIVCPRNDSDIYYSCDTITCNIENLFVPGEVRFKASFRLWTDSIKSIYNNTNITSLNIRSTFKLSTENSPLLIGLDGAKLTAKEQEVVVRARQFVKPTDGENEDNVVLYAALGAVGAVLFLGIVVFVLWKLKFFESKYTRDLKANQDRDKELNMSTGVDGDGSTRVENAFADAEVSSNNDKTADAT